MLSPCLGLSLCPVPVQPMWQTSGQPGTLYVVNSQSSQDSLAPRLLGLLSSFQLQPPSFQVLARPSLQIPSCHTLQPSCAPARRWPCHGMASPC